MVPARFPSGQTSPGRVVRPEGDGYDRFAIFRPSSCVRPRGPALGPIRPGDSRNMRRPAPQTSHDRSPLLAVVFCSAIAFSHGCGPDAFAPPPPSGLKGSAATSPAGSTRAREIVLILPKEANADFPMYEAICRQECGLRQAVFKATMPGAGDAKTGQAEQIRKAISGGASALIVVADGSPETTEAIRAIDRTKVPVILLGRGLPGEVGGPAIPLVDFPDVAGGAKRVVEAIAEDAKSFGLSSGAGVLLIREPRPDETTAIRNAAIEAALKEKGIPIVSTITGDEDGAAFQAKIEAEFDAHPDIGFVISDNDGGISSATAYRRASDPPAKFLLGGFIRTRSNSILVELGHVSAAVERNVDILARRAISEVFDALDGKPVPDHTVVEFPFRRSSRALNLIPLK